MVSEHKREDKEQFAKALDEIAFGEQQHVRKLSLYAN